jgi:hypothetical protein
MSFQKDIMAASVRREIVELQKLLILLEDNSHLDRTQKFDYGVTTLQLVETRLKSLRHQIKADFKQN